ncbi:uncharacterized protein LOC100204026 isoform X1 [Hydra vulgaris]|uniref:Hyaluronidase n=2 Tax=Hydra vulgaris TaxID=6087 RepID=A0ABM4C4S3_HYDVU
MILFIWLFWIVTPVSGKSGTFCRCETYSFDGKPFVAIWNSPTIGCDFNFSIPIQLRKYGIYENEHQTWNGNRVTVFSSAQLGLYPYYVLNGDKNYNGGLPQLVDMNEHLRKARLDIINRIPDESFNGLAVIDWEPWRPVWETNWATKRIYKVRSVELVRSKHPHWTLSKLIEKAKQDFEEAAKNFFVNTINLGKQLRPKALWGFYGFPDCFAHEENHYQCSPEVQKYNDRLDWLFQSSTALFPSMYLLDEHPDNRDYVLGRLRETLRFASKGVGKNNRNIPIFAYHRNIYENNPLAFNFLTKADLDNTVGLAADIGASGIIVWGNRFDENTSPEVCHKIDTYIATKLGPYIQNKQRQVESCNNLKCNRRGQCVKSSLLTTELLKDFEIEERKESCQSPMTLLPIGKKDQVPHKYNMVEVLQKMNDLHGISNINNTHIQTLLNKHNSLIQLSSNSLANKHNEIIQNDIRLNGVLSRKKDISPIFKKSNNHTALPLKISVKRFFTPEIITHKPLKQMEKQNRKSLTSYIDLGLHHNESNSNVDEFFSQVNVTKHNNTSNNLNNQSIEASFKKAEITNVNSNFSKEISSTNLIARNISLKSNLSLANQSYSIKALKKSEQFKITKGKYKDHKKSEIPRVDFQATSQLLNYSMLSNEKKSKLIHQLLAAVSGSLIQAPDYLHKKNSSREELNRKSDISHLSHAKFMTTSKNNSKSWLPHMYMILIGVSIGGALLFSLVFVAVYYYISFRKTFPSIINENEYDTFSRDRKSPASMPPKGHSSPKTKEDKDKHDDKPLSEQKTIQRNMELSLDSNSFSPKQTNLKNSFKHSRESHRRRRSADKRESERPHAFSSSYPDEKIKRSRSKERGSTYENLHSKDDITENSYNRVGREKRRSSHSELKRSKSRREKISKTKDGPEIEINVNDLR